MKISATGLKKLAVREGTVLHVYRDSKGLPTAGVGHLITPAEKAQFAVGKKITQAQSDAWLSEDVKECEDVVNESVKVSLLQNEFDACVSLAFNIGVAGFRGSSVVRRLNRGDKPAAAEAFLLWNKPPEIKGRRRTEYNQFLTPYKDSAAQPTEKPAPNPTNNAFSTQDDLTPPSNTYTVKKGDFLIRIAKSFNTSVEEIKRWNGLKSDLIKPGQKLIVKNG